jgi:hypothetical protein
MDSEKQVDRITKNFAKAERILRTVLMADIAVIIMAMVAAFWRM